ncbi:hypothetical protein C0992_012044, partial [Termitomyces sp. T32_za158]
MLEIQRQQLAMLHQKNMDEIVIKKRAQLIEEYKLGIWTKEEYLEQVSELDFSAASVSKHQKKSPSPDWDGNQWNGD